MKKKFLEKEYYEDMLSTSGFHPCPVPAGFPPAGICFSLDEKYGSGHYWIYESPKKFNVKIHDFRFWKDEVINLPIPECLSITRYDSISGEELRPYRTLRANVIKSFLGGYEPYHALIHKNVPIRSVGIEYHPSYYNDTLKTLFGDQYQSPSDAFRKIDETSDFPEMMKLLWDVKNYKGDPLSAALFYDGKAVEALSLIFKRHQALNAKETNQISEEDAEMLEVVSSYIGNHYADNLTIESLAKIACMGTTKLKICFKLYFQCTVTEYVQKVRLDQAEHFLAYTDLPVGEIAKAVGYSSAGHFADLFCRYKGLLPLEYRKSTRA